MKKSANNLYLHADGDSFFASCEISVRPELRGRPVIVGGDRGIAVAMSPEAKKLGVTRGMPVFQIKKFFPEVVILDHDFDLYHRVAQKTLEILSSYFEEIEEYSIDECFALVQPPEIKYFGGAEKMMAELKNDIEKTLGVTYSLGLARTKALAKQASKLEKPRGVVILLSKDEEIKALQKTPIDDIWGIGRQTVPVLRRLGLKNAFDFVNYPKERIKKIFPRPVLDLRKELSGEAVLKVQSKIDPRSQKSIQSTATFHPSSQDPKIIWRELAENAERASHHARELGLLSNKIGFFVKTSEFKYHFNEIRLPVYTADPGLILNAIEPNFPKLLPRQTKIRSTGIILCDLTRREKAPRDLFGRQDKISDRLIIEETADKIRSKHGQGAIRRVVSLERTKQKRSR